MNYYIGTPEIENWHCARLVPITKESKSAGATAAIGSENCVLISGEVMKIIYLRHRRFVDNYAGGVGRLTQQFPFQKCTHNVRINGHHLTEINYIFGLFLTWFCYNVRLILFSTRKSFHFSPSVNSINIYHQTFLNTA